MEEEAKNKLKHLIDKGSEISGGAYGTTLGLIIGGPAGAIAGAIVGPIVADLFKKIGEEISDKFLTNREKVRVGATYAMAVNKLENEIKNGKNLRSEAFYKGNDNYRSNAEEILEGTLLSARNEYEERKIIYYSNFLANLNLDDSISFEKGNTLLRIISRLSYRQFVILAYIQKAKLLSTDRWLTSFTRSKELKDYQDFYSEIMDLYNQQLLQQPGPNISMSVDALKLSSLGKDLCKLSEIEKIPETEKLQIEDTVNTINKYKA